MSAHLYSVTSNGAHVEHVNRLPLLGWSVTEQAEEGSTGSAVLVLDDPDMDFDIDGHRALYILEATSASSNNVIFGGITAEQRISRSAEPWDEPLGRVWEVSVTDTNAYWQRNIMVGSDCNRPAETDVQRMQWLLASREANWATDVTTWVSTANPVNMDAVDYRGQTLSQVVDDCAQASGKNWFTWLYRDDADQLQQAVWYGRDTLATFDSELRLSNDPADFVIDGLNAGVSDFWPISDDTELSRDPSRVYSGVYLAYDGGAVYRHVTSTGSNYAYRDFSAPSLNVKSSTKAIARAVRYLDELDEQSEVITTTVILPAALATKLRAGMRVPFKATHLPGYESFTWCRVLSCTTSPHGDGTRYALALELSPTGAGWAPPWTGDAFGGLLVLGDGDPTLTDIGTYATGDGDPSLPAGWISEDTVGPITPAIAGTDDGTITIGADMTCRIEAHIGWSTVATSATVTMSVVSSIRGVLFTASDAYSGNLGYWAGTLHIDEYGVDLQAGEVLSISGTRTGFAIGGWQSGTGPGPTFLRVGRGTHSWGGGIRVWTGY